MTRMLFLPGSGASPDFWKPVGTRLPQAWPKEYFGWPGLGDQPHDPAIRGMDDLVGLVAAKMDEPVDLVAQSMGGVIAARLALDRPDLVRRLVLIVTSGGVNMAGFGAADWRPDYRKTFPRAVEWITAARSSPELPVERIAAPTLLIWATPTPSVRSRWAGTSSSAFPRRGCTSCRAAITTWRRRMPSWWRR